MPRGDIDICIVAPNCPDRYHLLTEVFRKVQAERQKVIGKELAEMLG